MKYNLKRNLKNKVRGFTLVELIVVVGLFSSIATVTLGTLFNVQVINVRLQQTQSVLDNFNLSIQSVLRDVRFGSDFYGTTTVPIVANAGGVWTTSISAAGNTWRSVTYGNGLFVAVSPGASSNNVMISPDGITWTAYPSAENAFWSSVTYGNGLFVAVSPSGTNHIMTSPDGMTWTSRTSVTNNTWISVTYGNGLFVAVAQSGTGNRVMTSPDGITWTSRTSATDNNWISVTYGNGLFVALAYLCSSNCVMTSSDGINWTAQTTIANNDWYSVTYGKGLFVAVANSAFSNGVMTSPDGMTWTSRTSPATNWISVTYGAGLFVAVSPNTTSNSVMTSLDGITWTSGASAADNNWNSVTYGNGRFVAVAGTGSGNRVMTFNLGSTLITKRRNCLGGCTVLILKPSDAVNTLDRVAYYVSNGILYKTLYPVGGTVETLQMTTDEITIDNITFYVKGAQTATGSNDDGGAIDYEQPLITLLISGHSNQAQGVNRAPVTISIQTNVSARELDIK